MASPLFEFQGLRQFLQARHHLQPGGAAQRMVVMAGAGSGAP
jgi:hypothetical protein